MPPGLRQAAAEAQREREGAGGLVRASPHGPAEEEAGWGGGPEKEQGTGDGPEGHIGAPEREHKDTGGAEILFRTEDRSYGGREGGERCTAQGIITQDSQ